MEVGLAQHTILGSGLPLLLSRGRFIRLDCLGDHNGSCHRSTRPRPRADPGCTDRPYTARSSRRTLPFRPRRPRRLRRTRLHTPFRLPHRRRRRHPPRRRRCLHNRHSPPKSHRPATATGAGDARSTDTASPKAALPACTGHDPERGRSLRGMSPPSATVRITTRRRPHRSTPEPRPL
jgi:hypothetical protein